MQQIRELFANPHNKKIIIIAGTVLIFLFILTTILVFLMRVPSPPEDLRVTAKDYDTVNLTWVDHQDSDGYNVYRSSALGEGYEIVGTTRNRHYEDRLLEPQTTYYYAITAVKGDKESELSAEVNITTPDVNTIQNLRTEEVTYNQIKLVWDGFRRSEIYTVYRTDSPERPFLKIATTQNEHYVDRDLESDKDYYYRVTQTIDGEESERAEIAEKTREWTCGNFMEHDRYNYNTMIIGDQCWFAENLNYETDQGSWCYENREGNCDEYGRLYTLEAAMNGSTKEGTQGICPAGWRVPTDEDFKILERELGMSRVESNYSGWRGMDEKVADKIKQPVHCTERGEDFCGEVRFNLSMSGSRSPAGAYRYIRTHTFFWTSSLHETDENLAWRRLIAVEHAGIHREASAIGQAFPVRCIRN